MDLKITNETIDTNATVFEGKPEQGFESDILLPDYFAGRGVCLPVRVVALSSSDAAFFTTFEAAGINQTMQRVRLNVSVTLTVLSPAGTQQVTADSDVIVAETVVVGTVPKSYASVS